jgi:hypothetical protein
MTREYEEERADASRPLPTICVRSPSASRGADRERAILDGRRCALCDIPVGSGERAIRVDVWGLYELRDVCKGHGENPNSGFAYTKPRPESWYFCDECGSLTNRSSLRDGCESCNPSPKPMRRDEFL